MSTGPQDNGRTRDPVGRAFQVLTYMIEQPQLEFGVREIAKACALQPSTVHRALSSLVNEGIVVRMDQTDSYQVGLELLRLWRMTHKKADVRAVAGDQLRSVVAATNETTILGLYDRDRRQMVRVDSVESTHPLRYVFDLFQWTEIYRGASGLAILANLSEEERAEILTEAERLGNSPWPSRVAAEAELATIRDQGYAVTRGRRISGAVAVVAPIFDFMDRVVGDIILTAPEQRFDEALLPGYIELITGAAEEISTRLGRQPKGVTT